MNGEHVINWLIEDAERNADDCYVNIWEDTLGNLLYELNSRRYIYLPEFISSNNLPNEKDAVSILRDTFKNKISHISLILNYFYPEIQHLLRLPSRLELCRFLLILAHRSTFHYQLTGKLQHMFQL